MKKNELAAKLLRKGFTEEAKMLLAEEPESTKVSLGDIQWEGLEAKLSELLGFPVKLKTEETTIRNKPYVSFKSDNLIDHTGIFKHVFNKVYIYGDVGQPQGDEIWVPVKLRWEHISGGSNGTDLLAAWWASDGWKFKEIG